MRNNIIFILSVLLTCSSALAINVPDKEWEDYKSRMEELEIRSYSQNATISGSVIHTYENIVTERADSSNDALNLQGTYVGLNFDYKINNRLSFYSTLAMSKFWQNEGRSGEGGIERKDDGSIGSGDYWSESYQGSSAYRDSKARFDRAYVNYSRPDWIFSFALGRMPTSNGPVQHQLDGIERSGTYPRFAINAIFDGVATTINWSKWLPKDHSMKTKIIYSPFHFVDQRDRTNQQSTSSQGDLRSDSLFYVFLQEYEVKNLRWADNLQLYGFFYHFEDFWWEAYSDMYGGILWSLTANVEGFMNTGLNFSGNYLGSDFYGDTNGHTNGEGYLFNVNYKFANTHVVGAEWVSTNKDHYTDDWSYLNMADFYKATNNSGYHLFWGMPLDDNMRLRLGTFQYKVTGNSGVSLEGRDVSSFYTQLRVNF